MVKKIVKNKVAQNIGSTTFVIGLLRVAAMVAGVFLARKLSEADFGDFTLVRTLILVIPPIAIWGQNVSVARFFSQQEIQQYNWSRAFFRSMTISLALSIISVGVALGYYRRIDWLFFMLVLLATFAYCINLYLSNVVRSQKKFLLSLFINEGFRFLFLIGILVFIIFNKLDKFTAEWGFSGSLVLVAAYATWYSFRKIPSGAKPVPKELTQDAMTLMIISASVDIIGNLDRLIIGGKLTLEELALYAAVFTPLQIYMIFNRATHWVLVPVFGKQKKVSLWKYSIATFIIALIITAPFIFSGRFILHVLYGGKFDQGDGLIGILAISQALRMLYTMASSLIIGRLKQVALRLHMWFTVISVIIHILGTYLGVLYFGIWGAAYATLLTHSVRMLSAYLITHIYQSDWKKSDHLPVELTNNI